MMKYKVWLSISFLISLTLAYESYPPDLTYPEEEMYPLFTDLVSVFIFVPASFILASSMISLLGYWLQKIGTWIIILAILTVVLTIVSVKLVDRFHIIPLSFLLFVGTLLGVMHFSVSMTLKKN
ncbi:hypothetical protein [Bacillus sp. CECT 9360]|uniref:hypothetical protein n=1 Tax=Bacillus sp. CECT 9360 TaxID=2845821 RepID=UPI001E4441F0|nr:hypothetical protein [Bacillus sp. CECT 9360]CAH0345112.1 hypothetical protein BCI9360_01390 [Bacillus sp. CECT 9360]